MNRFKHEGKFNLTGLDDNCVPTVYLTGVSLIVTFNFVLGAYTMEE